MSFIDLFQLTPICPLHKKNYSSQEPIFYLKNYDSFYEWLCLVTGRHSMQDYEKNCTAHYYQFEKSIENVYLNNNYDLPKVLEKNNLKMPIYD